MTDGGPKPRNPLSPYYPSNTPSLSGNGRKWFAILIVGMLSLGLLYSFGSLLVSML